jgi:DNA-binding response OmpR family regulator
MTAMNPQNSRLHSVLVVDHAPSQKSDLDVFLLGNGFLVTHQGADALNTILPDGFDVAVVAGTEGDPALDCSVGNLLSFAPFPTVVLIRGGAPVDRIRWLEKGADDVMVWPDARCELAVRLRNLVRRQRRLSDRSSAVIRVGGLELWLESRRACLHGRELVLTDYEFKLLCVLARHSGCALSREQLLELAKGSTEDSFDRSIDVRVSRLRLKLSDDSRHPQMLKTVRGVGYVLVACSE